MRSYWGGGNSTNKDTWVVWSDGTSPNDAGDEWVQKWGDEYKHDDEEWDDGNEDDSDGCSSSWEIENMWIWTGGDGDNQDICVEWVDGESPNSGKNSWEVICGDGLKHSTEEWEDNNLDILL